MPQSVQKQLSGKSNPNVSQAIHKSVQSGQEETINNIQISPKWVSKLIRMLPKVIHEFTSSNKVELH